MLVCPETAEAERRAAKTAAKEERLRIAILNINLLSCYAIEIISDRCYENLQLCVVDLIILVIMCFWMNSLLGDPSCMFCDGITGFCAIYLSQLNCNISTHSAPTVAFQYVF